MYIKVKMCTVINLLITINHFINHSNKSKVKTNIYIRKLDIAFLKINQKWKNQGQIELRKKKIIHRP